MGCTYWWALAMQDDYWLAVPRLRNLPVLYKMWLNPLSFEITQKTEKSQMPSSFYWMKTPITQWP